MFTAYNSKVLATGPDTCIIVSLKMYCFSCCAYHALVTKTHEGRHPPLLNGGGGGGGGGGEATHTVSASVHYRPLAINTLHTVLQR